MRVHTWVRTGQVILAALALSGAVSACSTEASTSGSKPARTTVAASSATTTPDGAVPWIPVELAEADVALVPPTLPRVNSSSPLCRAEQLKATAFSWVTKPDAEAGSDVTFDKVWGTVAVVNASTKTCRLAGQPNVTISADPSFKITSERGGINDEAARRQVQMPPGEAAELRIDWSPPACGLPTTNQIVTVELPDNRGATSIRVAEPATPHCVQGESAEGLASTLSVGTFVSGRHASIPPTPAWNALTATAVLPATIPIGPTMSYEVRLTNPTASPIVLDPCPAYSAELFQMGNATRRATNDYRLYRLNCIPRPTIGAGETVRFLMRATLPRTVSAGALTVTWRLLSRGNFNGPTTQPTTTIVVTTPTAGD